MTTDRTLTRSGLSDQQGAWGDPGPGKSARKPPSAPRERKPALFALAVLLVALGAAAAGLLVLRAGGSQVAAIQVTQQVSAGQQFTAAELKEVDLPSTSALVQGNDYVSWSQEAKLQGYFATTTIMPGTLLTANMTTPNNTNAAGQNLVGLSLKAGQVPAGLTMGDKVGAVATTGVCGAAQGAALATTATVMHVTGDASAGGTETVTIAVQPGLTQQLTCAAANNAVALTQLPSNNG